MGERVRISSLEVRPGITLGRRRTGRHLLFHIFHKAEPQLFLRVAAETDLLFARDEPLGQVAEEWKAIGDWTTGRDVRNEFARVLAMVWSRVRTAVSKPRGDAPAIRVEEKDVVLGILC